MEMVSGNGKEKRNYSRHHTKLVWVFDDQKKRGYVKDGNKMHI